MEVYGFCHDGSEKDMGIFYVGITANYLHSRKRVCMFVGLYFLVFSNWKSCFIELDHVTNLDPESLISCPEKASKCFCSKFSFILSVLAECEHHTASYLPSFSWMLLVACIPFMKAFLDWRFCCLLLLFTCNGTKLGINPTCHCMLFFEKVMFCIMGNELSVLQIWLFPLCFNGTKTCSCLTLNRSRGASLKKLRIIHGSQ